MKQAKIFCPYGITLKEEINIHYSAKPSERTDPAGQNCSVIKFMGLPTWAPITTIIAHPKKKRCQMIIDDFANKNYPNI